MRRRALALVPARLELIVSGPSRVAARAVYRPGRLVGRIALGVATWLPIDRPVPESTIEPLRFAAALGLQADGYAMIRSVGRDQWIVALQQGNRVGSMLKIARGGQVKLLGAEVAALRRAGAAARTFRVPRVLATAAIDDFEAFAMEVAPRGALRADLEQALRLSVDLATAPGGPLQHGDLAPWNVLGEVEPWLIDWEMTSGFRPAVDFAHYVLASSRIGRLIPVERADAILRDEEGHLSRYAAESGHPLSRVLAEVREYRARYLAQSGTSAR